MFFNRKATKTNNQASDSWEDQEAVKWSDTEGYEAVRQVNSGLRWPSVWADRHAKVTNNQETKKKVEPAISSIRKVNKARSRQIKQKSDGLPLGAAQVNLSSFQAKEERRRQMFEARRTNQSAPKVPEKPVSQPVPTAPAKHQASVSAVSHESNQQQRLQDLKQKFEQKAWNRPSLTETSLVDSRDTLYFNWNKFWLILTQWLVVTLFFLSLCGALLYLWQQRQNKQATDVTQRFNKIDQLINLTENEVSEVLDFRLRLIMVNEMLSKHIYWNNFFSFLEKNTLPNVFYQGFSGDTKGDYILRAKTDNFDSMAKQIKAFRLSPDVLDVSSEGGEMIKGETLTNASSTGETMPSNQLNFSIRLKIKPELFFR